MKRIQAHFHGKRRWYSTLLISGWMFSLLVVVAFANTMTTYADSVPGGNVADPVVRAVDIAKPAVVRIITTISGHLDVQFPSGTTVTFPQGAGKTYQEQLSGSGTFITSNGDILTADHVVSPPPSELQTAAASDVATYISQHPETGVQPTTADQVSQALQTGQLKSTAHYDQKSSEVFLSTDYTGPLTATTLSNVSADMHKPVDQIEKESPFDQMDVAVVHAAFQDTPSVQLGDSSNVQQQDQLTIIGFPGNADINDLPQNLFTSSVNTITVSSIKTGTDGAPLIQVGGNVEHGDSGGPGLDSQGNVVGIVSFGLSSANSPGSTSFLQASNSARQLVTALNLNTTPGAFQKLWSQAFTDYAANTPGHWHTAQQEFQQISTNYPQFKALTPYLTYAQNQAKTEKVPQGQTTPTTSPTHNTTATSSPASWRAIALTVGVIAVLVLLVIGFFTVAIRGRKKKSKTTTSSKLQAPVVPLQPGYPGTPPANGPPNGGMTAFGAPPATSQPVPGSFAPMGGPQNTLPAMAPTLQAWPCGHVNRSNARFCTICGEPAPPPQPPTIIRRVEQ